MAFASSLSGNKFFIGKVEGGFNIWKTPKKSNNVCTRCAGKPHSSRFCLEQNKKCKTCEKVGHFSKICKSKPQQNSVKYKKQNNFREEKNNSPEQASTASEKEMFYNNELIFSMSATW